LQLVLSLLHNQIIFLQASAF